LFSKYFNQLKKDAFKRRILRDEIAKAPTDKLLYPLEFFNTNPFLWIFLNTSKDEQI
jgi:hypothetical protein